MSLLWHLPIFFYKRTDVLQEGLSGPRRTIGTSNKQTNKSAQYSVEEAQNSTGSIENLIFNDLASFLKRGYTNEHRRQRELGVTHTRAS